MATNTNNKKQQLTDLVKKVQQTSQLVNQMKQGTQATPMANMQANTQSSYSNALGNSAVNSGISGMSQQDIYGLFNKPEMTIDDFATKYGFDYSKDYANNQAAAITKAKEDAYNSQLRSIQNDVSRSAQSLDHDYFQKMLQQNQTQVNNGLNAGIAADQDLRLAMNRQNALADIYGNSNLQSAEIRDSLGRLPAEQIAYADDLYNTRRQQGYENLFANNQLQSSKDNAYAEYLRNVTNDNRAYAMQEAELMGNYIPYEARDLVQTVLTAKDQLTKTSDPARQQSLLAQANDARIQLASMGVNVDQIGTTSTFNNALGAISGMNKTLGGTAADYANASNVADYTGVFTDPAQQNLYNRLLQTKSNIDARGGATTGEYNQLDQLRSQLSTMGVDANKLAGSNVSWQDAQNNAQKLGVQTLPNLRQQADIKNENAQLALDKTSIDNSYKLGEYANVTDRLLGQEANANERLGIEYDYSLGNASIELERELGQLNYSIEQARNDLEAASQAIAASELEFDKAQYGGEETRAANTNALIGELIGKSPAEAVKDLAQNAKAYAESGVDIQTVIDTLGLREILYGEGSTTSSPLDDALEGGK